VIPALPGYGFSGKPAAPIGARTAARLFDRLMREFKVDANVGKPQVAYREALTKTVEKHRYTHKKQTGGSGQFADITIRVEPGEPGEGYSFDDKISGAANWINNPNGKGIWVIVGSHDARLHCVDLATGKRVWIYETDNFINGAPAVAKGRTVFGGCDGLMHVVNVKDGKKIKEIEIADYIAASAALTDRYAYVGHHGNKFVSVDLDKKKIEWQYGKKQFPYMGAPAVTKDVIVVGGQDNNLHCINRKDGSKVWTLRTRGNVDSSPVVAGDRVIVGSEDGRLYLVNLKDGSKIWEFEIGQPILSSPAVIDGMVIIGCDDGTVYAFGAK